MRNLAFVFILLAALASTRALAETKPTRSECIIGFHMDWSEVSRDRQDVANAMLWPTGTERIEPLTATRITPDRSQLFVMFMRDCQSKEEMAAQLIAYWRKKGLELPDFRRIKGPIMPSTSTIDVRGPYWRDGEPEGIPPARFRAEPDDQAI